MSNTLHICTAAFLDANPVLVVAARRRPGFGVLTEVTNFTAMIIHWFQQWPGLSVGSGLALALFFTLAAFVAFPRTLLVLAAGATFGFSAYPIIQLGDTVGCILTFLLSRYVAALWFKKRLSRHRLLRSIADAVNAEGWRIVALLRLGAPIPSTLQNYALGLTNIDLRAYSLATFLFSIPEIALLTFIGATGRATLIGNRTTGLGLALTLITIVTGAAIAWLVWRRARIILRSATERYWSGTGPAPSILHILGLRQMTISTACREFACAVIIDTEGRFLFQQRDDVPGILYPGQVGLFGGYREGDETFLECVVREVHEEIGYCAVPDRFEYLGSLDKSHIDAEDGQVRGEFFVVRHVPVDALAVTEGTLLIADSPELNDLYLKITPSTRFALELYFARLKEFG